MNIDPDKLAKKVFSLLSDMQGNSQYLKSEVAVGDVDGLIVTISVYSRRETKDADLEVSDKNKCVWE